jgi:hypothetical protein
MGKIVRLTESDLTRLVRRVITEQEGEQNQMKWGEIKKQFAKYNPKFRKFNQKGKLMYGTNPFKTYSQEIMSLIVPGVGDVEITYPYSETEGPDYDNNFVRVNVDSKSGKKVPLDFQSILKSIKN